MKPMTMNTSKPLASALARISSFDQKPANGKKPTSAAVPTMNVQNVIGMYFRRPPMSFFMSNEWWLPEWLTEPAPKNKRALKNAWVKMWKTPAVQAPTPSAITM